jgi:hypothetical protein
MGAAIELEVCNNLNMKISESLPEPLPAPRADDVLFAFDSYDPLANACLNSSWRPDLFYSLGYLEGARQLVNHVLETYSDQDTLIFPIAYLYRHHVELLLKRLLVVTSSVVDRRLTAAELKHLRKHRLDLLWSDIKQTLPASCRNAKFAPPTKEYMEGVDSYIEQLSSVDRESQSFRYPTSTEGHSALSELTQINIRTFAEKMECLCDFLASVEGNIQLHLDFEAEMRACAM